HYLPEIESANRSCGGNAALALFLTTKVMARQPDRAYLKARFWNWPDHRLDQAAIGNPVRCASVIRSYRAAGITHFVLDMHRHGFDRVSTIHEQLDRFARSVLPLLQSQ